MIKLLLCAILIVSCALIGFAIWWVVLDPGSLYMAHLCNQATLEKSPEVVLSRGHLGNVRS